MFFFDIRIIYQVLKKVNVFSIIEKFRGVENINE
jgi:hypothetical protein